MKKWHFISAVLIFTGIWACSGGNSPGVDVTTADIEVLAGDTQIDEISNSDEIKEGTTELPEGVFVNWDTDTGINEDVVETSNCPGGFDCACDTNEDCNSGWCVIVDPVKGDKHCTMNCTVGDCPVGWGCVNITSGGQDATFLCMPKTSVLCKRECQGDGDCGLGNLCANVGAHQYCLIGCTDDNDCPDNYTCQDTPNFDNSTTSKQCWPVTDSCICGVDVDYQTDPNNCSECEHKCEYANATPLCEAGQCKMGDCDADWWDIDKDPSNGCEYNCHKISDKDDPDPKYVDANCDRIDGEKVHSVFVDSSKGDDDNTIGDIFHPFKTITAAIAFAQGTDDRHNVLISRGLYNEQIVMHNGISLYGGYNADKGWARLLDLYKTAVMWNGQEPLAIRTVVAKNIVDLTVLDGLSIKSASNPQSGGSSYGVWVYSCSKNFVISNNTIESGNGGDGDNGDNGEDGQNGDSGQKGDDDGEYGGVISAACGDKSDTGIGGAGGTGYCNNSGGKGGTGEKRGSSGGTGTNGQPAGIGGAGGAGGGAKNNGTAGKPGKAGVNGADGAGGKVTNSLSPDKLWLPGNGEDGQDGTPGGGGGGGGGGGPDGSCCCYTHGGAGGGGGAGGCPGKKGFGGSGGGGSFAIFVVDSQVHISNNILIYGSGGNGGNGGKAGKAGKGGKGGNGGSSGDDNDGAGGAGGAGGVGGAGGAGAGGAGGPSIGIAIFGDNSLPACSDNDFEPGGFQGMGGTGGSTGIKPNNGENGISKKVFGATEQCPDPDTQPPKS